MKFGIDVAKPFLAIFCENQTLDISHSPKFASGSILNERNLHLYRFSCKNVHISTNSSIHEQPNTVKNNLLTVPIPFL